MWPYVIGVDWIINGREWRVTLASIKKSFLFYAYVIYVWMTPDIVCKFRPYLLEFSSIYLRVIKINTVGRILLLLLSITKPRLLFNWLEIFVLEMVDLCWLKKWFVIVSFCKFVFIWVSLLILVISVIRLGALR